MTNYKLHKFIYSTQRNLELKETFEEVINNYYKFAKNKE
jgi:hypothetical protein